MEPVGRVFTVTSVLPAALVHEPTVAVTLYAPEAAVVTFAIVGFCREEVNPLGPLQL
jgi:hypothetical protein